MIILWEEQLISSIGRVFENENVHEKVLTFNKTILNILSNFIPHKLIVSDNKDPPWFKKDKIHEKTDIHSFPQKHWE